jgi:hypothetical protein
MLSGSRPESEADGSFAAAHKVSIDFSKRIQIKPRGLIGQPRKICGQETCALDVERKLMRPEIFLPSK